MLNKERMQSIMKNNTTRIWNEKIAKTTITTTKEEWNTIISALMSVARHKLRLLISIACACDEKYEQQKQNSKIQQTHTFTQIKKKTSCLVIAIYVYCGVAFWCTSQKCEYLAHLLNNTVISDTISLISIFFCNFNLLQSMCAHLSFVKCIDSFRRVFLW